MVEQNQLGVAQNLPVHIPTASAESSRNPAFACTQRPLLALRRCQRARPDLAQQTLDRAARARHGVGQGYQQTPVSTPVGFKRCQRLMQTGCISHHVRQQALRAVDLPSLALEERLAAKLDAAVQVLQAKREEAAKGTRHGVEFEAALAAHLRPLVGSGGDILHEVGATTGVISHCKVAMVNGSADATEIISARN